MAVSVPMAMFVPQISLSMLPGMPITLIPCCESAYAPFIEPSPPITISASMPASFILRIASRWPVGSIKRLLLLVSRTVPPRCKIPPTSRGPIVLNSPLRSPSYPCITPITFMLLASAVRTTARMAAFIPGASPPEVRTPIVNLSVILDFSLNLKIIKIASHHHIWKNGLRFGKHIFSTVAARNMRENQLLNPRFYGKFRTHSCREM